MKLTTARTTGLFYLGLAVTGVFAFLFAKEQLFIEGDAAQTTANLIADETLARFGLAAEVLIVGFQALAAVWFYKLFRKKDSFAAGLIAVFGIVNAIVILAASAFWLLALNTALAGGLSSSVQTLFETHDALWQVGSLFFGLWLLPMAYMARKSGMPKVMSWFLIAGGIGYILSTFTGILLPEQTGLNENLPLPATIGEFWMIGYLLFKQVKD
jgi:hypothetical protein